MQRSLESLASMVKQLQHRQNRLMEAGLAQLGVSLVQWNALREIQRNPGRSLHGLAELTFNSDQAFGALTTRLLRLGLVERRPGAGRAVIHSLTEQGEAVLHQGHPLIAEVCATVFATLTNAERAALTGLISKLLNQDCAATPWDAILDSVCADAAAG